MTAIKYVIDSRWENAVIAIIFAACFDALDGATARLLKATSRFGAEIDSLADSVNFGIVPAIALYMWLKEVLSTDFDLITWDGRGLLVPYSHPVLYLDWQDLIY